MTDYQGLIINYSMMNQKCTYCKQDLKEIASLQMRWGFTTKFICVKCLHKLHDFIFPMINTAPDSKLTLFDEMKSLSDRIKELEKKNAKSASNRKTTSKSKDTKKVDVVPEVQNEDTVRDTSGKSGRGDGLSAEVPQV